MKIILAVIALAYFSLSQIGCSGGASVGHDGHSHGAAVSGTTSGPGVGAGARVY